MRRKISTDTLNATYGSVRLADRLLESLQEVGYDLGRLSAADLITFDELHVMGRQATVELGRLAGLTDAMRVLDIGSGLGGSARTLAAEFGCHVTGVDLSEEFVDAALVLSERVGLADRVDFRHGDALKPAVREEPVRCGLHDPCEHEHRGQKRPVRGGRTRVETGGKLVLWEICKTEEPDLTYPVPWAEDESFSFLIPHGRNGRSDRGRWFQPASGRRCHCRGRRMGPRPPGTKAGPAAQAAATGSRPGAGQFPAEAGQSFQKPAAGRRRCAPLGCRKKQRLI